MSNSCVLVVKSLSILGGQGTNNYSTVREPNSSHFYDEKFTFFQLGVRGRHGLRRFAAAAKPQKFQNLRGNP